MGYETTLLIGTVTDIRGFDPESVKTGGYTMTDDYHWFHVYAEIDLCVAPAVFKIIKNGQKMYFYGTGHGGTQITEDSYGEPLFAHPAKSILIQLKESDEDYRRYKWAIALLESMIETAGEEIHVLIYGH